MGEEADGLQEGDASDGKGHESPYCISGNFEADKVDDMMQMAVDF